MADPGAIVKLEVTVMLEVELVCEIKFLVGGLAALVGPLNVNLNDVPLGAAGI